jgi:long-chain fatty acid transport protein
MLTKTKCLAAALLASAASSTHSAGFALIEQSASGLGNAYAGGAAAAEDASTIFFNPAGMVLLPDNQIAMAGHLIKPSIEFSGTVSPAVGGNQGGDAGRWALVPSTYIAHRLTPRLHAGLGVNAPFGLKTEYDDDWIGRFQAIKSEAKAININPSIAWKLSENLAIGAGLNVQRMEATLSNSISPLAPSSLAKVEASDYGWGYNLGVLWQPGQNTRMGLAYRSGVDYTLEGKIKVKNFGLLASGPIKADMSLPATASISIFHRLSPEVDLLADATWTGWSSFDRLTIRYANGTLISSTPENWENIMRYSLGATWHVNDRLSLRGGVAYEAAPMSDAFRTPRIPDGNRTWLALGGQYRLTKQRALDVGYARLFFSDPKLDKTGGGTTLDGKYSSAVDVLGAQYTHGF